MHGLVGLGTRRETVAQHSSACGGRTIDVRAGYGLGVQLGHHAFHVRLPLLDAAHDPSHLLLLERGVGQQGGHLSTRNEVVEHRAALANFLEGLALLLKTVGQPAAYGTRRQLPTRVAHGQHEPVVRECAASRR